jgi:hypothetical protein
MPIKVHNKAEGEVNIGSPPRRNSLSNRDLIEKVSSNKPLVNESRNIEKSPL